MKFFLDLLHPQRLAGDLLERLRRKKKGTIQIQCDKEGFSLSETGHKPTYVRWMDIDKIVAFKRDLLASDLICFQIRLKATEAVVEVNEEIDGFPLLVTNLERLFPKFDKRWSEKVAKPPFLTTYIVILDSSSTSNEL